MGEPAKTRAVEVDKQRVVRSNEDVNTHIELLMPDQQRVVDVTLHDVGLGLVGLVSPL